MSPHLPFHFHSVAFYILLIAGLPRFDLVISYNSIAIAVTQSQSR
jgi:hypothetical protein